MESEYNNVSIKTLSVFYLINIIASVGGILSSFKNLNFILSLAITMQLVNLIISIFFYISIRKTNRLLYFKIFTLTYYVGFILIGMWFQLGTAHPMFIVYSIIIGQVIIMVYSRYRSIIFSLLFIGLIFILFYIDMFIRIGQENIMIFTLGRLIGVVVITSGILITVYFNKYEMDRLIDKLSTLNRVDSLTGAWNSKALYEDIEICENDYIRKSINYILVFIDLDEFKMINDNFGHNEGDLFLVRLVQILKSRIRRPDKIYRIGGDEFVLIMKDACLINVDKIVKAFRGIQFKEEYSNIRLNFSYGIVARNETDIGGKELIKKADFLMYEDKSNKAKRLMET